MKEYTIRLGRTEERRDVENLVRESFWNVYRPGCLEHYVMHCLRDDKDFIPELNFVMEANGQLIGQAMCMRAKITADNRQIIPIMTLGPICIHPDYKRQGFCRKKKERGILVVTPLFVSRLFRIVTIYPIKYFYFLIRQMFAQFFLSITDSSSSPYSFAASTSIGTSSR